jgi:hypothetical protein
LSNHTQQLKKDLDKTITFIVNKSKNGKINLTPAVESKIETYDRYICDGIFEFLENKDVITEAQAEQLKDKADGYMVVDGSGGDYKVIERGGMKLPKRRAYSKLGVPIAELEKQSKMEEGGITQSSTPDYLRMFLGK